MISLDVISLYTSIHVDILEPIVIISWNKTKQYTAIPKKRNYKIYQLYNKIKFQFKNDFYKHINAVAMGNSLSSVIAQMVLEDM